MNVEAVLAGKITNWLAVFEVEHADRASEKEEDD
jgi:hypothetical protein